MVGRPVRTVTVDLRFVIFKTWLQSIAMSLVCSYCVRPRTFSCKGDAKALTLRDIYCETVWSLLAPLSSTSNMILLGVNAVLGFQRLSELNLQELSFESNHCAAKTSGLASVTVMTVSLVNESFMCQ